MSAVLRLKSLIVFLISAMIFGMFTPLSVYAQERAATPTSNNLADFVQEVTIEGLNKDANGNYVYFTGQQATVKLHWAERPNQLEFAINNEHSELYYDIPAGLYPDVNLGNKHNFDITLSIGGADPITVDGNTWRIEKNNNNTYRIILDLNKHHWAYNDLVHADNTVINLSWKFTFNGTGTNINFGNNVNIGVVVDDSTNVQAKKRVEITADPRDPYNQSKKVAKYTIDVYSSGESHNVTVQDTNSFDGNIISFRQDSVSWNPPHAGVQITNKNANGFTAVIPHIGRGQTVTLTYYADVNWESHFWQQEASDFSQKTSNSVQAWLPDKPKDTPDATVSFPKKSYITKQVSPVIHDTEQGFATITWTIEVNQDNLIAMAGKTITDWLGDHADKMQFAGDGITFSEVYNEWNQPVTGYPRTVSWNDLRLEDNNTKWTYTFPEHEGKNRYKITYQTRVQHKDVTNSICVTNNVAMGNISSSVAIWINPPNGSGGAGPQLKFNKQVNAYNRDNATWTLTAEIPEEGYTQLSIADTLPNSTIFSNNDHRHQHATDWLEGMNCTPNQIITDQYSCGDLENAKHAIEVRFGNEKLQLYQQYTIELSASGGANDASQAKDAVITCTVTFYESWLASHKNGTLTVKLKTVNNPRWKKDNATQNARKNTARMTTNKGSADASAEFTVSDEDQFLQKKLRDPKENNTSSIIHINNQPHHAWDFMVVSSIPGSGDLVIEDYFDTEKFALVPPQASGNNSQNRLRVEGVWKDGSPSGNGTSFQDDATYWQYVQHIDGGARITIPRDKIPSGFPYVGVTYTLMLKKECEEEVLKLAQQSPQGITGFTNAAVIGGMRDEMTFTVESKPLTKTMDPLRGTFWQDQKVMYTIDVNPHALQLGTQDTLTVTDTMSKNLRMDMPSLKIHRKEGHTSIDITGDCSINTKRLDDGRTEYAFVVPNRQHIVITYKARVLGQGSTEISNSASVNGATQTTSNTVDISTAGSGSAWTPKVTLVKHDQEIGLQERMQGAVFNVVKVTGTKQRQHETVVGRYLTQEDGSIVLDGTKHFTKVKVDNNKVVYDANGNPQQEHIPEHEQEKLGTADDVAYYVQEIIAPSGYELDSTKHYFKVSNTPSAPIDYAPGDHMAIANKARESEPGVVLPSTGGVGHIRSFMFLGGVLVLGGFALANNHWRQSCNARLTRVVKR